MKIQEIEITDVGGIPYLKLDNLNTQMNIICGENGVGKTNILESIARCYTQSYSGVLKKRANSDHGSITINTDIHRTISTVVKNFNPSEDWDYGNHDEEYRNWVMYFKTSRSFPYTKIDGLQSAPNSTNYTETILHGVNIFDIKNWFIQKELFSGKSYNSAIDERNIQLAKACFSILNNQYSFSKVDQYHEIYLNTPTGIIPFEYLSSGFKSSLSIIFGIIKEIEYRFTEDNAINASDFNGVILIDEIELHLHPEWQAKICNILKDIFPKAQFFITTHSPHILQTAKFDEVIALEKDGAPDEIRQIQKRDLRHSPKYGFQGWTIEEILVDVMGMQDTRSDIYKKCINEFNNALEKNNKIQAVESFKKLKKMLHPDSHIKKMLEIQMTTLE